MAYLFAWKVWVDKDRCQKCDFAYFLSFGCFGDRFSELISTHNAMYLFYFFVYLYTQDKN